VATRRRILIQVTLPALLVGCLSLGTCVIGLWSINRLQTNRTRILSKNVRSLQAAQEMEIRLRQLRFHSFVYLMDPRPGRRRVVDEDNQQFEKSLRGARELAELPGERSLLDDIEAGYRRYRADLDQLPPARAAAYSRDDLLRWADAHPVGHLMAPCEGLLRLNWEGMEALARESESVGQQSRGTLLFLGVLGPVGGLISGFGVAWGLSRSITRLRVRLRDASEHLDQELGSVRLTGSGDLSQLDRQLEHVVNRVREVVARSRAQQQEMLRAEQLAAVGQLAANVAHEVRNPLTSVKLLVGAALRARPPRPLSTEDLQVIHDEVARLEGKVQALLDFARPPEASREPCDLRELVERSLELVRPRVRQNNVQTEVGQPAEPVVAEVDRDQFTSVLVNLFLNALDAMPRGGRLEVTVAPLPAGGGRLTVADTGGGIPAAVANRLFAPFNSTKPTGTGLGLSICRRVVQDHGGTLAGENRREGGARFTITLPRSPQEASHADLTGR
jgi:signal transduction histidine kinase